MNIWIKLRIPVEYHFGGGHTYLGIDITVVPDGRCTASTKVGITLYKDFSLIGVECTVIYAGKVEVKVCGWYKLELVGEVG